MALIVALLRGIHTIVLSEYPHDAKPDKEPDSNEYRDNRHRQDLCKDVDCPKNICGVVEIWCDARWRWDSTGRRPHLANNAE